MADLLSNGVSALLAYQRALDVTAHNIANVNTAGYTRQTVELTARVPEGSAQTGSGGVTAGLVTRAYDAFLTSELRTQSTRLEESTAYSGLASQLDALFADSDLGLSAGLESFFASVSDLANDPSSLAVRQAFVEQADSLVSQMQFLDQTLGSLADSVNGQITEGVVEINRLADSIADINSKIRTATGMSEGQPPNDLLDQRDQLVNQLAELVSVKTVSQGDGTLNVFVGSGQALVVGDQAQQLTPLNNEFGEGALGIGYVGTGGLSDISDFITGGSLGGVLAFQREMLQPTQAELDRIATGLADSFNTQHQLGIDLNGQLGGDFFTALNDPALAAGRVSASNNNVGDLQLSATIDDVSALGTSDYLLSYQGGSYSLARLSDGVEVASFAGFPVTVAGEGFTLNALSGTVGEGDRFLVQPTAAAARSMEVVVGSATAIAAASPLATSASVGNSGSAVMGAGALVSRSGSTLPASDITLAYDGAGQFTVSGGGVPAGTTLAYDPATDSGKSLTLTVPGLGDFSFTMSGTPASGDAFTISNNSGGVGDNRNALALAGLETTGVLADGRYSLQDAYGALVTGVGSRTNQAQVSQAAQQSLFQSAQLARDNYSGVNLDEEAANLIRYQQAYQAAAQVIAVADTLFQTLLSVAQG